MRYLTIVSTAFIAATAAPAFALPWGLGIRGVEHDALVQRDVADELYTRELTARSPLPDGRGGRPIPRPPRPGPPNPHPRPRPGPRPPHPAPGPPRPYRRELDEYARELVARSPARGGGPRPSPIVQRPHPEPRPKFARGLEDDELFARAMEDELYARMEVDELD
ncbi:uncharacterized protein C8Q71DRAFT_720987 [Rhodofomes roseus]|uniref:Uncharacterized protein n=1 Tax=Rhodofomes roseus TaxID=34475 RepID=A0ABQ8KTR3_9APHY|nr:uncharacterized protein C8Q71DRAFT_720987 [Rhodofomes roseus]KAH9841934.1 hypothetical protein C8Q71DRAFT_720987 [Rhodofomes roseus]